MGFYRFNTLPYGHAKPKEAAQLLQYYNLRNIGAQLTPIWLPGDAALNGGSHRAS